MKNCSSGKRYYLLGAEQAGIFHTKALVSAFLVEPFDLITAAMVYQILFYEKTKTHFCIRPRFSLLSFYPLQR